MPKKRNRSPEPREDEAVKIDGQVKRMAQAVAYFRGLSLAHYLSDLLRAQVTADFDNLPRERKSQAE